MRMSSPPSALRRGEPASARGAPRRRRGRRRVGLLLLALAAAFVGASLYLFVWPPEDSPGHADAIVVLSGSRVERLPKALELRKRLAAPVLVISGGFDRRWRQALALCRGRVRASFRVVCFTPRPSSTLGEAQEVERLARRRGWRRLVVVSSTYHVVRARMLFRRCVDARVDVVGARPPLLRWIAGVPNEWGKLVYQLTVERNC
jgi:uncharacterized SAM-binding protein YcdF (DUF218 family)